MYATSETSSLLSPLKSTGLMNPSPNDNQAEQSKSVNYFEGISTQDNVTDVCANDLHAPSSNNSDVDSFRQHSPNVLPSSNDSNHNLNSPSNSDQSSFKLPSTPKENLDKANGMDNNNLGAVLSKPAVPVCQRLQNNSYRYIEEMAAQSLISSSSSINTVSKSSFPSSSHAISKPHSSGSPKVSAISFHKNASGQLGAGIKFEII